MPDLADDRWPQLRGGYRTPFDPRRLIAMLQSNTDSSKAWDELWNELHHQGDVGEASYAAVPHLVQLYLETQTIDWNTYALVATIELARGKGGNPEVPDWFSAEYFRAIQDLARKGLKEIEDAESDEEVRTILSMIALWKGARTHARMLLDFSGDEILDLEKEALGNKDGG
jgi:hypothetical protein